MSQQLASEIQAFYDSMETYFISGEADRFSSLPTSAFVSIGPDGSRNNASAWVNALKTDLRDTKYSDAIFNVDKVTITDNTAVAYISKQYIGTNNQSVKFKSTVLVRDVLVKEAGNWKLSETEIIKRDVSISKQASEGFGTVA